MVSNRRARSVVVFSNPISPSVCLPGFEFRDRQLGARSALGTSLGAREASLLPAQPHLLTGRQARCMEQFPGRQRRRDCDTPIDTNHGRPDPE